ncbi:MAG: ACP S-malonyltransferase [Ruminococcus sp.]|jgi:[acyl-carrier-protein] S-malonyltransferase|nr:ACP S-malonyltransferase [Ruminococcus sp.]
MSKICLLYPGQGSIKLKGGLRDYSQTVTCAVTLAESLRFMKDNPAEYIGIGHSLGEFAMLTAAGVFTPLQMCEILDVRTKAMEKACEENPGAMYAIIGIPPEKVIDACIDGVFAVNFNSDVQTVISGEINAVTAVADNFIKEGVKAVKLDVRGAFHTPLMKSAAEELRVFMEDKTFGEPEFPLYSNVTGEQFKDFSNLPEYFYNHMISPVRFTDEIRAVRSDFPDVTFYEPGKTLTGMLKRIK